MFCARSIAAIARGFWWTNKTGAGLTDRSVGLDMGVPFFSRL
eukprot:SAG25_NODE_12857_length_274_cov_0.874286_1_plen_41_part_10